MPIGLIIGIGGGLASALLFYSSARGGPLLRLMLLLLTPLPSLVAGFGWGWIPAAVGAVAGGVLVAILGSGTVALGYVLALGVPVTLASYLAYLSRPDPHDATQREWYPLGRLMAAMAIYAGALPVMLLALTGGSYEVLRPLMLEVLRQFAKQWAQDGPQLTEQQLAEQVDWGLFLLPAVLAVQWLLVCAVNLYLAGRITLASGRLGRDWPDIAAMTYPLGFPLLLVLALLATNAAGTLGVIGTSFSGAFLCAHLLAGLALAHYVARQRAPWLVWLVYFGLLFLWPFFMPLVALAGLIDTTFSLKQRLRPSSPPPT